MATRGKAKSKTLASMATDYTPAARHFHWVTVAFVAVLAVTGIIMAGRAEQNIWDAVTNNLYSTHKLLGFILFWIVVWRITYRVRKGWPAPEPTLEPVHRLGSTIVHYALYGLLFIVPLLGWLGVSMFPALEIFGLFKLPALAGKSDASEQVLNIHKFMALTLLTLVAVHVAAALYHYFIRKDGVLARMLPSLKRD
jgi:cytochrome b561